MYIFMYMYIYMYMCMLMFVLYHVGILYVYCNHIIISKRGDLGIAFVVRVVLCLPRCLFMKCLMTILWICITRALSWKIP
jgi:hypothetical protein